MRVLSVFPLVFFSASVMAAPAVINNVQLNESKNSNSSFQTKTYSFTKSDKKLGDDEQRTIELEYF